MQSATKIFSLRHVVMTAWNKSPYYRQLYAGCNLSDSQTVIDLASLPIVDQTTFWQANTLTGNLLLTEQNPEGVVFRSGGTTGSPKFSIFSKSEWETFTEVFGQGLTAGGLRPGERIANYFYGGALYASFLFIYKSLEHAATPVLQFPIAGGTDPYETLKMIEDFDIGTIAGVPTGVLTLAQTYAAHKNEFPKLKINRILFGGESMHVDQRRLLGEIFPGVDIRSIGYASVDAGLLGYADSTCGLDEHRAFGEASIVEIVDDATGEVILEPGKPGRVLITSLTRCVMPIIRYPAGDLGQWVDDPKTAKDPRFKLLGRGEEAARVGPVSLYFNDIELLLATFKERLGIAAFQIEVFHRDERDGLILRVAVAKPESVSLADTEAVLAALFSQRPMLRDWAKTGKVHTTHIEWVSPSRLAINPRTGKMRRIIDQRY